MTMMTMTIDLHVTRERDRIAANELLSAARWWIAYVPDETPSSGLELMGRIDDYLQATP